MSALKGDLSSSRALKATLRAMPLSMAHDVSRRAAPVLTDKTRTAYDSGRSVYGEPRPAGADGAPLTLNATGATRRDVHFTAQGTVVRCVLGPKNKRGVSYPKYLIGKYGILPNGPLPAGWSRKLQDVVRGARDPLEGAR
jgi:hypothetical protein